MNISDVDIYVCIVLAAEDVTTVTLSTLDPQGEEGKREGRRVGGREGRRVRG